MGDHPGKHQEAEGAEGGIPSCPVAGGPWGGLGHREGVPEPQEPNERRWGKDPDGQVRTSKVGSRPVVCGLLEWASPGRGVPLRSVRP